MLDALKKRFRGRIHEVPLGPQKQVLVGGETGLPLHAFETAARRTLVALEITDQADSWPELLLSRLTKPGSVSEWAKRCEDAGSDVLCLSLAGPGQQMLSEYARILVAKAKDVSQSVSIPLIVNGTGDREVDNLVLPLVARELSGQNMLIGPVTEHNYREIAQACLDHGHIIIAQSPIDINIAKQLNILLSDMGVPLSRIVMDPTTGGLGYGIEYTYSIIEKARLAALDGDRMLACPVVCFVGQENWKLKEACWAWEATAATALAMGGAQIVVVRDPESLAVAKQVTQSLSREAIDAAH